MESIAQFFVASADLVEAEGRALKRQAGRVLLAFGIGIVALAMVLTGLGFVVFGLLAYLARVVGWPGAAMIFGLVAFGVAAAAALQVKKLFK